METRPLPEARHETRVLEEHWAWLVPVRGDHAGRVFVVRSPMVVGSAECCDLRLQGDTVAPRHFELTREGSGKWTITDLAGDRRTKLDGAWLQSAASFEIADGQRVEIGSLQLVFKCVA